MPHPTGAEAARGTTRAVAAPRIEAGGCGIRDWRELAAAACDCFPDVDEAEFAFHFCRNRAGVRILRSDGRIAAFCVNNPAHSREFAWLEMLGVTPAFRHQGLGRRALCDYEAFVRRLGYPRIELAVDADNRSAIELYESCGYSRVPRDGRRLTYCKQLAADAGPGACGHQPQPGLLMRALYRLLYRLLVGAPGALARHRRA